MKKNLFEIISKELYKLPKWRTHEICSRFYWGLDVIPKTYDEICVSVSLNKYIITFYLIPLLYQIRSCCWKYRKWGSHLRNCYHFAKVVENERVDFSISPYCTLLFSRKENFNFFWFSFDNCSSKRRGSLHYECMRISALKYFRYHIGHLIFKKWSKKAFKQGAKFVQTWQVYYSNWLSPCYCVFFFINLEHLLHPTLLLLFKLLKGERWLKVYGKLFVKITQWW